MARSSELIQQRNAQIIEQYNALGKKKLKEYKIYQLLKKQFFLTDRTLYYVISGEYEKNKNRKSNVNPNQLSLLDETTQLEKRGT